MLIVPGVGAIAEKDWRAVVKWLEPLVEELGVEVLVTDDLKELDVAARQLHLGRQVCHFHVLRWLWRALRDLRNQLSDEHHPLPDQVWELMKTRPPDGRMRLYTLWKGIQWRRRRAQETSALYRLRLLIDLASTRQLGEIYPRPAGSRGAIHQQRDRTGHWAVAHPQPQHAGLLELGGFGSAFLVCSEELLQGRPVSWAACVGSTRRKIDNRKSENVPGNTL